MNVVISDTAEYGCYLFSHAAMPLLQQQIMPSINSEWIGKGLTLNSQSVDNQQLLAVNEQIRQHPIDQVGRTLRQYMTDIKSLSPATAS